MLEDNLYSLYLIFLLLDNHYYSSFIFYVFYSIILCSYYLPYLFPAKTIFIHKNKMASLPSLKGFTLFELLRRFDSIIII